LPRHLWEKGRNECAGETCFEAMAFLPHIAAASGCAYPPLPKDGLRFTALALRSLHQMVLCVLLVNGQPLQECRLCSCYLVCMDQN
jgi:hypothetical protein